MMPLSTALAVVLLTAAPDSPVSADVPLPVLQSVAVSLELLDPRECRYVLARPEDFAADVKLIRHRWEELADAPPLCDCERFPSRAYCTDMIARNREYRKWLEDRQQLFPAEEWAWEAIQECDRLYAAYDFVRDFQAEYYYLTVRRKAMLDLRERIGVRNYYGGFMPPPVPVWRARRID